MNLDGFEVEKWKAPVNLLAKLLGVSTVLLTKYEKPFIEVLVSSESEGNPIKEGIRVGEGESFCGETARKNTELQIPNSRKDPKWEDNPILDKGMIAYIGLPLLLPDGKVFGTLCVLDNKENNFNEDYRELLRQFRDMVEAQLKLVYRKNQVVQRNLDLEMIQNDLIETSRLLKEKNESLEDFVNFVSHDLKEPIRKIKYFGGQARNETETENCRDKLSKVLNAADRMEKLIDSFLELSRINSNGIQFERTDLNTVVMGVLDNLETLLGKNQVLVEAGNLPVLEAHSIYIAQMFQNLLINAVKFKKEGQSGVVKIKSFCRPDGGYDIHIEDDGVGFDMKYADKIFEPLAKLKSPSSKDGSGLGLAIVRKVVQCHGGSIRAESNPGEGAVFVISFPAYHPR
ncbi:MAG: GAF domain-containing protein [Candidatus Nitronauta litoralis]|uniref:histidine kinase n=1 Tax=Candidatus Nitronauta litoralis TaxID=2705533 RepID=A0A7T0BW14_9BACT|nr:MAG: GAF domain-containing protein [Candidatus Nitronauta litoralis]